MTNTMTPTNRPAAAQLCDIIVRKDAAIVALTKQLKIATEALEKIGYTPASESGMPLSMCVFVSRKALARIDAATDSTTGTRKRRFQTQTAQIAGDGTPTSSRHSHCY